MIYFLFFCSGVSGLIYQVIWVREFGNAFGNTVYSASLVVAIFMLGLGIGSYWIGRWADRQYATSPNSLLRTYGLAEGAIAALGLLIAFVLPHLDAISSALSWYTTNAAGWHVLSVWSYLAQGLIATVLLTPITLLMGGTLTLLIRHLVRRHVVDVAGTRIAILYGINTAGAALGALLTDTMLVPSLGLRGTQTVAALLNMAVAAVALVLAQRQPIVATEPEPAPVSSEPAVRKAKGRRRSAATHPPAPVPSPTAVVTLTATALALAGFGALGMEIVWFRHFTLLLGAFRAVFSLLLGVLLVALGAGALAGGLLHRITRRPAIWLMIAQGLFVAFTLFGLTTTSSLGILTAADAAVPGGAPMPASTELLLNITTMTIELGIPALLMGLTFPLGNAVIQDAERSVGQRAGLLYLANTIGAVAGSLAAGFLLLPGLGLQQSATTFTMASALSIVPLYLTTRLDPRERGGFVSLASLAGSALAAAAALLAWLPLPPDYLITRAQQPLADNERVVALDEGVNEVITVADVPNAGRQLLTNGHPMSSTNPMSQRYMRALAHVPMLMLDRPVNQVLVIGFGVGETVHAATLHPTAQVELADLSAGVLEHAHYFADTNKDVLKNPRLSVYVNDGRQHLRMRNAGTYDLVTLEPPPITHAGVGSLYSKDFYALVRTRLKPKAFVSQWLPAYQVTPETTLALVRAFVDVFPQSVLLSGADAELLLIGTNDDAIRIDPQAVNAALARDADVAADLQHIDLRGPREIVGAFVAGPQTLADATHNALPATDDWPVQEYTVRSLLSAARFGIPGPLMDASKVSSWCPTCFADGRPVPAVAGLDRYMALLSSAYRRVSPLDDDAPAFSDQETRQMIQESAYLENVTVGVHNLLGVSLASEGKFTEAIQEFRQEISLAPQSPKAHHNLGKALAAIGAPREAIDELRLAASLDPSNVQVVADLGEVLLSSKQYAQAVDTLRAVARVSPGSADLHTKIGMALVADGKIDDAIAEFRQALSLQPNVAEAQNRLNAALDQQRRMKGAAR